jgi:hypothetical protein
MRRAIAVLWIGIVVLVAPSLVSCTTRDTRVTSTGTGVGRMGSPAASAAAGPTMPRPVTRMRRVAAGSTAPTPRNLDLMARKASREGLVGLQRIGVIRSADLPVRSVRLVHDQQWETTETLEVEVSYPGIRWRVNAGSGLLESYEASIGAIVPGDPVSDQGEARRRVVRVLEALTGASAGTFVTGAEPSGRVSEDALGAHFWAGGPRILDGLRTRDFVSGRVQAADGRVIVLRWRRRTKPDPRPVMAKEDVLRRVRAREHVGPDVVLTAELEYWMPDVVPHETFYNGKVYRVRSENADWRTGWWGVVDASTGGVVEQEYVD